MSLSKYPTPEEIAEMKARGYEPRTIREAEERAARWPSAQALCEQIREAFRGVTLGNGVGLKEALGLDDYADEATLARYHAEDEREDWTRIPMESLNGHDSSLTFTDEEGMRFLLPAYMIAELLGSYGSTPVLYTIDRGGMGGQFRLFTPAQRAAVRAFLRHLAEDPEYKFERDQTSSALENYWAECWDMPGWH
jgi:hypothetical protein